MILERMFQDGKFPLGELSMTQQIAEDLTGSQIISLLLWHSQGDWGEVPPEDAQANEWSSENEARIISSYTVNEQSVWVITEADRSVTTVLYSSEY